MPTIYKASAQRDGRWWFIEIPEIDAVGQSPTLAEAPTAALEIAMLMTDLPESEVLIDLEIILPGEAKSLWDESRARAARAREDEAKAAAAARTAILLLSQQGITQADIARALGLSAQRVHQLLKGAQAA